MFYLSCKFRYKQTCFRIRLLIHISHSFKGLLCLSRLDREVNLSFFCGDKFQARCLPFFVPGMFLFDICLLLQDNEGKILC